LSATGCKEEEFDEPLDIKLFSDPGAHLFVYLLISAASTSFGFTDFEKAVQAFQC
jgi:hypothetical protein